MAAPRAELQPEDHYHHAPERTELEKALTTSSARLKPYGTQIAVVVAIAIAVGLGAMLWSMQAAKGRSIGWNEFLQAKGPEELESVADKHPGTASAMWSRLQAGRVYLQEGLNAALTDRKLSDERLTKAKENFEKLLATGSQATPEVREEALYGLATSLETLSNGDNKPAIDAYETLIKDYPKSVHTTWAQARVEALKEQTAKDFYAWFRQQNPQPGDRPSPLDLPTRPPADDTLLKDIKLPDIKLDNLDLEKLLQPNPDTGTDPLKVPEGNGPSIPGLTNDNGPAAPEMPANPPVMNAPANPEAQNAPALPEQAPPATTPPAAPPQP